MPEPISIGEASPPDQPSAAHPTLLAAARMSSRISSAALYVAGAGLVVMSVIVLWQVFLRYVLSWSNAWTELSAVLIMSWFIFLGAAVGVRENYHLGFDVLIYVLPNGSKRILRTISDVVVFAFSIGMVIYGITLMRLQWQEIMPGLGVTGSLRYLPLAAGGVLIALFSVERVLLRWSGVDVDKDAHEKDEIPSISEVKEV